MNHHYPTIKAKAYKSATQRSSIGDTKLAASRSNTTATTHTRRRWSNTPQKGTTPATAPAAPAGVVPRAAAPALVRSGECIGHV